MRVGTICLLLAAFAAAPPLSAAADQESGFFASADWINWKARRSGMDFVIVDPNTDARVEGDQVNLNYDRDNGARVVLGYHLGPCWDASMEYQTYRTKDQLTVTQPAGGSLWGTRLHPDSIIGDRFSTSVSANATLDYDVLDFMISRRFAMDSCQRVNFSLYGDFRYAMIDQTIDITYADSVNGRSVNIHNPIKLDGYGIRAGGQLDWNVRGGFSLFGKGAISVLAARVDSTYTEHDRYSLAAYNLVNVSDTCYQAVPVIETALGMAYQRGPWEVAFGYEMAIWGNTGSRIDFEDDVDEDKFSNSSNDLILDGFFLRFCFNR